MKLRDLLELCRVSNLPTVWSNVAVGSASGAFVTIHLLSKDDPGQILIKESARLALFALLPLLSISCLYCAGMVLNDYWDREIDSKERPGRPIPSGRVTPKRARNFSILLFAVGMAFPILNALGWMLVSGPNIDYTYWVHRAMPMLISASLLTACIVAYNRLHAKNASTVVLMALCRVLAVVTAATMFAPWPITVKLLWIAGPALTVGIYTLAISIVARNEVEHDRAAKPGRFVFLPRWLGGPKVIMNMIAAMPLLDALWLVVMGLWPASLFCVACAGLTKWGHRKVAGS